MVDEMMSSHGTYIYSYSRDFLGLHILETFVTAGLNIK